MPRVLRNSKFFTSAFLCECERVLQVVVCAPLTLKRVNIKSSVGVFFDLECASPCDACKARDSSELLIMAKPSNEKEISHGRVSWQTH
jgi:hypothetical protein